MTSSTELALIPPRLVERGVAIIDRDGYRTLGIPPEVRTQYNVIFPTVELSQSNPDFAPMLREIALNLETDAYTGATFHKNGECSLGKNGLLKLSEAAKVDIDTERIPASVLGPTERCGWKATCMQRHSDGTLTRTTGSAVFDNEAEMSKIKAEVARASKGEAEFEKRWTQKTLKASELTETIAIERALRAILKLPHKMASAEFKKPWLVLCYGFVPQTPEARAEAARAMAQLYGGQPGVSAAPAALPPVAALPALPAGDPADEPPQTPVAETFDDEPAVVDGEVVTEDEEQEQPTTVSDETASTEAIAEAAASMKPPVSGMQEYTLEQIAAKQDAEKWFKWALGKDFSAFDPGFNQHLRAFCIVRFPALVEAQTA